MAWLTSPEAWVALVALTALEIVLGIDNIIFISILTGKLPQELRARARTLGLALAMILRIALLFSITWIIQLTSPIFELFGQGISGRDLILIAGGLFLLGKATQEIHQKLEGEHGQANASISASFTSVLVQIMLLDIVFSIDSVITAVGMANELGVMVTAVVIAVGTMMILAGPISAFVERHPTVKILALCFLILIGMSLVTEGLGQHIPKGYLYFAMGFSVFVEALNLRLRRSTSSIDLRSPYVKEETP
ncbi:MAG: TerC family protein [Truepera sp.]|nr:TerC family protein [Truepera sp.]